MCEYSQLFEYLKVCIFEQQTKTISLAWKRERKCLGRGNRTSDKGVQI